MNKPNGRIPQNVPILGAKKYRCQKGHEWTGDAPAWSFMFGAPPNQQGIKSGPVCLVCLLEWASFQFPIVEDKEALN